MRKCFLLVWHVGLELGVCIWAHHSGSCDIGTLLVITSQDDVGFCPSHEDEVAELASFFQVIMGGPRELKASSFMLFLVAIEILIILLNSTFP